MTGADQGAGGPSGRPGTLTVLGCDGSYPGPGGAASGYLVGRGPTLVWLDAGPGTFANLQRHVDPGALDAVVLTHEHPDHWSDLESLAVWALLAEGRPPIPVYAPSSLRRRSYFAEHGVLDWREIGPAHPARIGDLDLRFARTDHGPPTMAVRIDPVVSGPADRSDPARALAYSADTGPGWSIGELGSGLGTVLCEATYPAADEGFAHHLSGRQAGAMAAAAEAGTLVVTHRWPTVAAEPLRREAEDAFGRPVSQAAIGAVFRW